MTDPHGAHHGHAGPPDPHASPPTDQGGHDVPATPASHAEHDRHAATEGHDKHAGHSVAMFRDKFLVSLALTVPTLIWGHMLQGALGYQAPTFAGSHHIAALFGTAVFLYGGTPFLKGALQEIRDRLPGMMTLIALAISVAFAFSVAVLLGFPGTPLWEELATLVTVMLLGHWLEMRSISQARGALGALATLLPTSHRACVATAPRSNSRKSRSPTWPRGTSCSCGPARRCRPMASSAAGGVR